MKKIFFILFTCALFGCGKNENKIKVSLLPLGNVSSGYIDSISVAIKNEYNFDVVIIPEIKIPEKFFINIKSPRYRADLIIKYLLTIKPDSVDYLMGITEQDISVTKRDETGNIKNPEYKYSDCGFLDLAMLETAVV